MLSDAPHTAANDLFGSQLEDAGAVREVLRRDWVHRCASAFLLAAFSVAEGNEFDVEDLVSNDPLDRELRALWAIRNAITHNDGHLNLNRDEGSLELVQSVRSEMNGGLWGPCGHGPIPIYWEMDGDRAIFQDSAFHRIMSLFVELLDNHLGTES